MWYVVQVRSGTEESIRKQYGKLIEREAAEQCFIPYYEEMKRYRGENHREKKILFPGYVFMISDDAKRLFYELKHIMGFTKLLGTGDAVIPLTQDEIEFMTQFGGEEHVVAMSKGIIVNDRAVVLEGPLKGREGLIRKIDRHKKKAWLEVTMFGRPQRVEVGLEILEKNNEG